MLPGYSIAEYLGPKDRNAIILRHNKCGFRFKCSPTLCYDPDVENPICPFCEMLKKNYYCLNVIAETDMNNFKRSDKINERNHG